MTDPTARQARGRLPESPPCPFCDYNETELMNAFGSQLSVSTYWCRLCRSPFEFMKWLSAEESGGAMGANPGGGSPTGA